MGGKTGVGQGQHVNIGELMLTYVETINILLLLGSAYILCIVRGKDRVLIWIEVVGVAKCQIIRMIW